jgi:hypothetical protein
MRGKIACSATKLSVLDPAMIHSVVDAPAYQVASQYRSDNRVRIVEADERQVSSVVIGNSGVYELTIHLKDGFLTSKCTCSLNEQPLCRHSIAVLLEYHRWCQPKTPAPRPAPRQAVTGNGSPGSSSVLDIKLSEITGFIEWLQLAAKALNQGLPLPQHPNLDGSEASTWVKAVETLDERRRQSEEKLTGLETDLRAREAHLGRVTQQLQGSVQETKAAQAACETLREELAGYAAMHARVMEMSKGLDGLEEQIRKMASDFSSRAAHLNGLTTIVKELSVGLQSLAKKP